MIYAVLSLLGLGSLRKIYYGLRQRRFDARNKGREKE